MCGWLRRANRPPDLPARLGTPVDLRSTPIRGRGFAAYLSACGGQPFNVRCAHYARGASLSTFGFVTIVPRYLLPQVIPSHSFAALTALIVRRVNGDSALLHCINGFADQPMLACTSSRTPPRRGIGVRTRRRHLAARFMAFAFFIKRPTPIIPKSDAIVNRRIKIFCDFFRQFRKRTGKRFNFYGRRGKRREKLRNRRGTGG